MSVVAAFGRGGNGGALVAAAVVVGGAELLAAAAISAATSSAQARIISVVVRGLPPESASGLGLWAVGVGVSPREGRSSGLGVFFRPNPRGRLPNTDREVGRDEGDGDGDGDFERDVGDVGDGDELSRSGGAVGAGSSTRVASVLCEESVPRSGSSSSSSFEVTSASLASSRDGVTEGVSAFSICQNRLAS